MKRIKNLYRKLVAAVVLASGLFATSCTDYLTIIPPSVVVHENFWRTEAEVNGMVATAYLTMFSSSAMRSSIIWGETRAETVAMRTGLTDDHIEYLMEGLLYDDNSYAPWTQYYNVINNCNLVLEFGPQVMEHDPNFTEGDMQIVEGQMLALRAMAHFYLVRAFCDIPLATTAVMTDAAIPEYFQVNPFEALNAAYADLEKASRLVLKSGYTSNGYITTNAVYALMADIDMWRAAFSAYYSDPNHADEGITPEFTANEYYDKAIANCERIMSEMQKVLDEEEEKMGITQKRYPYDLIPNDGEVKQIEHGYSRAYNEIFGDNNSSESIFEFQIDDKNYEKNNHGYAAVFSTEGKSEGAILVVQKNFLDTYFAEDDLRKYAFTTFKKVEDPKESGKDIAAVKYTAKTTAMDESGSRTFRTYSEFDANWIVYRKPEIMLMLAEALVSRKGLGDAVMEPAVAKAINLTNTVHNRWIMDTIKSKKPLSFTGSNIEDKRVSCLQNVRDERARELCFEGKRWYDIVRMALQGEDTDFSYKNKTTTDPEEMLRRYNHISAYFMPIAKDEIRFNKNLHQNKSCRSSEESAITKK